MTVQDVSMKAPPSTPDQGIGLLRRAAAGGAEVLVVHAAVPGRVRLTVPVLRRDPDRTRQLEGRAAAWRGVRRATASATTGSLLLEYDPAATTVQALASQAQAEAAQMTGSVRERGPTRAGSAPSITESAQANPSAEPSVPPTPRPRSRAIEGALGGAALLAAGAALLAVRSHGHNLALDQAPLAVAEEIHSPALTALMRGASGLVEPAVLWPVTIAATLMGVGRRTPGDLPWLAPTAVLGGGALVTLLKTILRRGRPSAFEHLVPTRGYSLPSGHAFLAVSLYGLLAHHAFRWLRARRPEDRQAAALLLVAAATAVLMVGASRVYLGVHYPTDVIAGYALALLWLFFLAAINDRPRPAPVA
jgi:membrane-associated phospholipid phosphatase